MFINKIIGHKEKLGNKQEQDSCLNVCLLLDVSVFYDVNGAFIVPPELNITSLVVPINSFEINRCRI